MRLNRSELAAAFGVTLPTVDKWERLGMPVERSGSRGRPSVYSLPACIRWRRQRDAAMAAALPHRHVGEHRADREEVRQLLRQMWLDLEHAIPWKHRDVTTLADYFAEAGISDDAEMLDQLLLGFPILPPARGVKSPTVSRPHADLWVAQMKILIGVNGGDGDSPSIAREMRSLCGTPRLEE